MSEAIDKKAKPGKTLGFLFGVIGLFLLLRWLVVEPYVIPSGSMIPSLLTNDYIFVNKSAYGVRWPFTQSWIWQWEKPERGEVVVFLSKEKKNYFMVKRVIGLPGDTLEFFKDGSLQINGEKIPLAESGPQASRYYSVQNENIGESVDNFYWKEEQLPQRPHRILLKKNGMRWAHETVKVPEDTYFVLGDNRDSSRDSRYWGALPKELLVGRAMFVWMSCNKTLSFAQVLCDPFHVRWNRIFHQVH